MWKKCHQFHCGSPKSKAKSEGLSAHSPVPTNTYTLHTVMCPQTALTDCTGDALHIHSCRCAHSCLYCAQTGKKEKGMLEWISWMSQHRETAQQHWWAEPLLSAAWCLDGLGCVAARGHMALSGVLRGQDKESSNAALLHHCSRYYCSQLLVVLPALIHTGQGYVICRIPSSPPKTSSFSHADEPRDHPRALTVHRTHIVKRTSHAYKERSVHTHSLSRCVK